MKKLITLGVGIVLLTSLIVAQGPPAVVTPTDNSFGVSITTTSLTWSSFDDGPPAGGPWDLDISQVSNFSSFIDWDRNLTGTSYALANINSNTPGGHPLDYNTTYYWRILDSDVGGGADGPWYNFSFSTQIEPGQIAYNSFPSGTSVPVASQSMSFTYTHVGTASDVNIDVEYKESTSGTWSTLQNYVGVSATFTSAALAFPVLKENTTYDVRIVVENFDNNSDNYTTAGTSFTTADFPVSITESPGDTDTGLSLAPTFTWTSSDAATSYTLEVGTSSGASNVYSGIESSGFSLSNPDIIIYDNTTYYWQVTYNNSASTNSVLFGPYSFTTDRQTLSSPGSGTSGVSTSGGTEVTFTWDPIAGTEEYQVSYGTTSGVLTETSTWTSNTTIDEPYGFLYNTTYYWVVEGRNNNIVFDDGDNPVETSTEFSFTTEIATPVMTAPTGYDGSRTPTTTWTFAGGTNGVTFDVQYSLEGLNSWNTADAGSGLSGTTTSFNFASGTTVLDYNTDYDIRVVAKKSGETDKPATPTTFKTLLPTPTLDAPLTASTVEVAFGDDVTLDWSIPAATTTTDVYYDVYSGPSAGATVVVSADQTHATGTDYLYTPTTLGMQDWYVMIKDQSGAGPSENLDNPSAIETFEVLFGLVAPVNSLSGVSLTPLFKWDDAGGLVTGTDFDIEIDDDPAFGSINYTINVVSGDYTYSSPTYSYQSKEEDFATPMSNNSQYYWRVKDNTNTYKSVTYYFYTVNDVSVSLSAPGDGAAVYLYDPLQFGWYLNQAQGSLRFMLQIKDTSAAPGAHEWDLYSDFEYDHISSIYRSVNGLDGGTRYYWRIVAYFDDGSGTSGSFDWGDRVVKYSSVFYFDTQGGAVTAYPSWPVGGNTIYNLTPTFYWYTLQYEPSATYEVLYSTDGTTGGSGELTTGVTTISAGSNIYVNVGATLLASTDYYWQVKTSYTTTSGTEVKYSSVAEFTTYNAPGMAPTAATPSYPTGGVEIYTQSPTFYWYIGGYNVDVNFTVEVDDDPGFGSVDFTFGTTQSTYIQGSGLVPGTTYHWRVVSSKSGYTSVTGPSATFSVAGGLGTSVVLSWPTGNPLLYSATPTLSWYLDGSSLGWSNYVVRYKKGTSTGWASDYDFSYSTSSMTETFYNVTSALEYGETYYWAVALYDGSTPVADGDFYESSFTIAGGAASAGIVQTVPANNSTDIGLTPTFYWYVGGSSLGIDKYKVRYSNTELFTANVVEVVSTSTYASASSLDPGTTYWWEVWVSYDAGATYTQATAAWKFTTAAGLSAVMPLVGSPANGASVSTTSPVLSWYLPTQSSSALSYEVELSDNAEFNNAEVFSNISQLSSQVSSLSQGEYYWRVKSTTGNSTSNYSNVGKFKLGDGVTSVDDGEELPLTYSIDQNYPNPFNPSTSINYSIPTNSFVSIKIYDMLGQEVKALVNQEMKAGRHTLNWNGDNNYGYKVSSGTYIYRITAGNFVQSKKMILLK